MLAFDGDDGVLLATWTPHDDMEFSYLACTLDDEALLHLSEAWRHHTCGFMIYYLHLVLLQRLF
jgi:hypothetical protein